MNESPDSSKTEFNIRPLNSADIDAVFAIEKAVYEDPWSFDLIQQSLSAPMTYAFGLFRNSEICAYSIFQIIFTEGHILNLAVSDRFQKQGWGRKLLDAVLDFGKNRGVHSFFLEVRPTNESAKQLYEKRGFRQLFVRPHYYSNGESAIVMTLDLMD